MTRRAALVFVLLLSCALCERTVACTFAEGYFHQVPWLRGRVVGTNLHSWGPLQPVLYIRPLRQSFSRSGAILTLYEYRRPIHARGDLVEVARRTADKKGLFDFGELKPGHYTLIIDMDREWSEWFDVEVTDKASKTKHITIDVSPVYPDCKGGHEFIVETES